MRSRLVEIKGLDKVLASLHLNICKKTLNRTVNDIGTQAKNKMLRDIRKTYNIISFELKQFIKSTYSGYMHFSQDEDCTKEYFNQLIAKQDGQWIKKRAKYKF